MLPTAAAEKRMREEYYMKQVRYYVSRRNPLTWLAGLLSVGAAVMYILALCFGESAEISTVNIWFQKVLPIWCALG